MNSILILFIVHFIYYASSTELRIVGGYPIEVPDYYVALIDAGAQVKEAVVRCGSTLITEEHLLTAAHCYISNSMKPPCQLYDAVFRLENRCKGNYSEVVSINKCSIHPKYTRNPSMHDIAILVLSKKVNYSTAMLPLIKGTVLTTAHLRNKAVSILGYGKLIEEINILPCLLRMGEVYIMRHCDCLKTYMGKFVDKNTMFCAASKHYDVDTCQGDTGGGLVFDHGGVNIVMGITSFGKGCAKHNIPTVYTYVSSYLQWIQSKLKEPKPRQSTHKNLKRKLIKRLS